MTRNQQIAAWVCGIYLVFWMGGNSSFSYTHNCVRSHTEEQAYGQDGDTHMVTVCDWYSANGKRWTFGDPVRALQTAWLSSWEDDAVAGALAVWFGVGLWRKRRQRRGLPPLQIHES